MVVMAASHVTESAVVQYSSAVTIEAYLVRGQLGLLCDDCAVNVPEHIAPLLHQADLVMMTGLIVQSGVTQW